MKPFLRPTSRARLAPVGWTSEPAGQCAGREVEVVYDPSHPLANEEGMVRYPDIDMGDQMVSLMMAQRGYQANLAVVERATTAYQAALQLGKR